MRFDIYPRRVGYFTLKAKNTTDVGYKLYLRTLSYATVSSTSSTWHESVSIGLPPNMTEFQTIYFDGAPAITALSIYLASGIVIDEVEFHEIVE